MCIIESYVFFDIETTGLPWQENNRTKITELSFVVALRKDVIVTQQGDVPPVSKLTLVFNPGRPIHPEVVKMNGLSNDLLQYAPIFGQKINTIVTFLKELPKPVCLVAHNGNKFDFKILLAELCDVSMFLPNDLLCVDSLVGFRQILACNKATVTTPLPNIPPEAKELLTDDEDEWPDLNLSTEEWKDIDEICDSLSDISCDDITQTRTVSIKKQTRKKQVQRTKVIDKVFESKNKSNRGSYTLKSIYNKLLNKDPINHHRAECDCFMLLECVIAVKDEFIIWADSACKRLTEVKPLVRQ